ncbi:hypothetical protein [Gorillibacterium sp. sgz5001074]|uniref:hypothetical protein n=1 Tax=Gorillibacterium sp. sgz5001074 TaxID=3446695 RepID=UPI003F6635C0
MLYRWIRKSCTSRRVKKLRLLVWRRRLDSRLKRLLPLLPETMRCTVSVAWGPLYGGSAVVNRACTTARIFIQLPYDRYLSGEERTVMDRYAVAPADLPYFILFHEFYHLLDLSCQIGRDGSKGLQTYRTALIRAVRQSSVYKDVEIEQAADDFAYHQLVKNRPAAS